MIESCYLQPVSGNMGFVSMCVRNLTEGALKSINRKTGVCQLFLTEDL